MFTSGEPNQVYKPRNEISDTETNQVYKPGPPLPNPNEHLGPYAREASGSDIPYCR